MASIPTTMRALQIQKQGGPEVLEVRNDVPVPKPGKGQVLIKVDYAGVNFLDVYQRQGIYSLPTPLVLGNEPAGTVVAFGEDVEGKVDYNIGDKVAAFSTLGGFAQYAVAPALTRVSKIPASISTRDASAAVLQALTAVTLCTESHNVQKGEHILIYTIAGGMGLLLSQYCAARGAIVYGTTSSAEKIALAKAHGANHVFNYKEESYEQIVKKIKELTGGEGVHAVFDGVGKDTFDHDLEVLRRKGSLVTFGNASGTTAPVVPLKLTPKNLKLLRPSMPNYVTTKEEWQKYSHEVFDLIASGKLKLNIHKEYPLTTEGVKEAQSDLVSGKSTGKLVIKID